jgi:hypothetical protein
MYEDESACVGINIFSVTMPFAVFQRNLGMGANQEKKAKQGIFHKWEMIIVARENIILF